ncbi:MAG: T9SS type B sorting domain-containing protein [Bacteroidia bacterium]|nr:T9SS type B sorting domain-containing protein [Bacteroidia bacterium]
MNNHKIKLSLFLVLLLLFYFSKCIAQNNNCNLKALITPQRDTIVVDSITTSFINISQGATSVKWLLDGIDYYFNGRIPDTLNVYLNNVGIRKIELVVTNGNCIDTARCFVVVTGKQHQKKAFSNLSFGIYDPDFRKQIHINNPYHITGSINKDFIISGSSQLYTVPNGGRLNSEIGFIADVTEDGCINWAKSLSDSYYSIIKFSKKTLDNDILSVCSGALPNNGATNYIIRTSSQGVKLWAKAYDQNFTMSVLQEDSFENIIVAGSFDDPNGLKTGFSISKLDKNGNKLWSKIFRNDLLYNSFPFTFPINILTIGNYYYVSGFTSKITSSGTYGFICKLNAIDGSMKWTKKYTDGSFGMQIRDMHFINNQILANVTSNDVKTAQSFFYIDTLGNVLKSFKINTGSLLLESPFSTNITTIPSGGFYLSFYGKELLNLQPGYQYHSITLKISPQNTINWQKQFGDYNRDYYLSSTINVSGGITTLAAGYNPLNTLLGSDNFVVTKIDSLGNTNDYCNFYQSSHTLQSTSISFTSQTWKTDSSFIASIIDVPYNWQDVSIFRRWLCPQSIDTCSLLGIDGPEEVCDLKKVYSYRIHKSPGCGFNVSGSSGITILSQTDSILKVSFNSPGIHKLKIALANSCALITDSLLITAAPKSYLLSLGRDTSICAGSTIILNAGNGFASYKWQDGSTSQFFKVKQPGIFFVTAIDSCNNIAIDSIMISPTLPTYLGILKNSKICLSDTVTFQIPSVYSNYSWTPSYNLINISTSIIKVFPTVATTYTVKAIDNRGCIVSDSAIVSILSSQSVFLGNDTVICKGDSLQLNAGSTSNNYVWSTGSTTPKITVSQAGNYSVVVTDTNSCKSKDTITVFIQPIPYLSLGNDTSICANKPLILTVPNNYTSFLWSNGSTNRKLTITNKGLYWLTINAYNCVASDTINIVSVNNFPSGFISTKILICPYDPFIIAAKGVFVKYLWNTGDVSPTITINRAGIYSLKVTDTNGCDNTEYSIVQEKACTKKIIFPNAFTPNNDGNNDVFKPFVSAPLSQYHLYIYNRYGQVLFESNDSKNGWNGNIMGIPQQTGVYVWKAIYAFYGEDQNQLSGNFTLIK